VFNFRLEIDNKIRIGNMLIKTLYSNGIRIFSKGLYGKLGWGFVGKSDICFSIKIDDNRIRVVRLERREKVFEVDDLKQIFPC
jgi:hypothetical protein